jgi:5-oxoprolinase (ATP-hydrolysing)
VKLVVGPESAGADPGPACYGRGGPLTVTDCNLFLGRVIAERFPFPLDGAVTEKRLRQLATEVNGKYSLEELAAGLLRIANANMAAAIRLVTVAKGANPADYLLVAFGSAAPQHACAIARELGIRQVLVHRDAGILSAVGIGLADVVRYRSQGIERPLNQEVLLHVREQLDDMERDAAAEIRAEGVHDDQIAATRSLDLRYQGVDSCLTIPWPTDGDFAKSFATAHRTRYGYTHESRPLEIAAAHVEVVGSVAAALPRSERMPERQPTATITTTAYFDGHRQAVPLYDRDQLSPGDCIAGPALISEPMSTTVIEPGWQAEVLTGGGLLLSSIAGDPRSPDSALRSNAAIESAKEATTPLRTPHSSLLTPHFPRSRLPRSFQQLAGEHRGPDGRHAPQHGQQRERQGTARLQLRDLYARRPAGGQRAPCARASRCDGRNRATRSRRESRFAARRRVCHE